MNRAARHLILLALLAGPHLGCDAGSPPPSQAVGRALVELRASADKVNAQVGDVIHYTLTVEHAEGLDLSVPDVGAAMAGLSITDIEEQPPVSRDGRVLRARVYSLRADLAGSYPIPEVSLSYPDESGETVQTIAPAIFIEVAAPGEDAAPAEMRDIKPLKRPVTDHTALIYGAAAVALLAALSFVFWWRNRRKAPIPVAPPLPAWELARLELAALERRGLLEAGDHRAYFFELSEILRRYMDRRYGVHTLEKTSEEVTQLFARGAPLSGQIPQTLEMRVRHFLTGTDQIKYAKHEPTPEEVGQLIQDCERFVAETTPRQVEPATPAPGVSP